MSFRPLHDRVVVKRIEAEEKSAGGIIIPDTAKKKPSQGEVIAVGPGGRDESGKLIPIDIEVGDRVLFGKWSWTTNRRPSGGMAVTTKVSSRGAAFVKKFSLGSALLYDLQN